MKDIKLVDDVVSNLEFDAVKEEEFLIGQRVPKTYKEKYDIVQDRTKHGLSKELRKLVMDVIDKAYSKCNG